jgi:hypothetical protein
VRDAYSRVLLLEFPDKELGNVDEASHCRQLALSRGRLTIGSEHDVDILIGDIYSSAPYPRLI